VARLLLARLSSGTSRSNPHSTVPSTCPNRQQQRQWRRPRIEPESSLHGLRNQEGEKASSHSTSSSSCCPGLSRAPTPRHFRLDPRQERRLLSTAILSNSSSSSSATMPERHTARSDRQGVRVESGAERHQVSSPAQTRHYLPSCTHTPRPSDARSAAAAPRASPYGRGKARRLTGAAAERPIPRCGGSSQAPPTLTPPHPPALAPGRHNMHSRPPSRSAGRSYHSRPQQGGAPQRHHRLK